MTKMNELTAAAEFLNRKFPHGGRVLCAVSGGLDSMCLLDYMARQPDFSVGVAHFNHRLRGRAGSGAGGGPLRGGGRPAAAL